VQIIHATETIPFDVAATRTIHFDHHDLDSVSKAREEIVRQIHAVERNPDEVDTPISVAVELQSLRRSDNPLEKSNAEIITMLQELKSELTELREQPRGMRMHPRALEDLMMLLPRLFNSLEVAEGKEPTREQFDESRQHLKRLDRAIHHICMESGMHPEMLHDLMRRRR